MLEVLLSGFFGAVIGGLLSYLGAVRATKTAIESQETQYRLEKNDAKNVSLERKKRHMYLIQQDMKLWIQFAIERTNRIKRQLDRRPPNVSYNNKFRDYLESFIIDLSYDELEFLIRFYGIVKKTSIELEDLKYTSGGDNEVRHNLELIIRHVGLMDVIDEIRDKDLSRLEEGYFFTKTCETYRNIDLKFSNEVDI